MRELHFEYFMEIKFEELVTNHRFSLKCVPRSNSRQKIEDINVVILPAEQLSEAVDAFGNHIIYGSIDSPHDVFHVSISGNAYTGLADGEVEKAPWNVGKFKIQSSYTMPSEKLKAYFHTFDFIKTDGEEFNSREKAIYMMQRLYRDFQYVQGVTDIYTTAAEAYALKKGVCQDYSHILLSLCRMADIPARYVVGMLSGEGYSHAWVEIYFAGKWYGMDPTNGIVVNEDHIKISSGRDYNDCLVNQGLFLGGGKQTQTIHVTVEDR